MSDFEIIAIMGSIALFVGLVSAVVIIVTEKQWQESTSKQKKK